MVGCYAFSKVMGYDMFVIEKRNRRDMFWRAFWGNFGLVGLYTALEYTSLSKATVIFWTLPLFVALFAMCMIKEKLTVYDWTATLISFFGMILLQNPFGNSKSNQMTSEEKALDYLGMFWAFLGATLGAIAFVYLRKLSNKGIDKVTPTFYFALIGSIIAPLFSLIKLSQKAEFAGPN